MNRLYIITGVTGNLGHIIANTLIMQKHRVRGLILPNQNISHISPKIELIEGDITDKSSLIPLFKDTEQVEVYVIHTAGIITIDSNYNPMLYKVNVLGTQNIIELSQFYKVKQFIYTSSVHALPELNHGQIITEESFSMGSELYGDYSHSKREATHFLMKEIEKGFNASIVFPSGIVSTEDSNDGLVTQMVKDYLARKLKVYIKGGYDFVDVRDVSNAIIKLTQIKNPQKSYILANQYYSVFDLMSIMYKLTGIHKVKIKIPLFMVNAAMPMIHLANKIAKKPMIFTKDSLHILNANSLFSSQKAKDDLNYNPRDIRVTLKDLIENLKSTSIINNI